MVVSRGQVLRIEQVRGGQVVDLNLFGLSDARERLSASRTRVLHGLSIALGDTLWSAAPRERPLMTLIADSAGARHDVTFPACSAFEYAFASGVTGHTNCAEIQAESIRRFGLMPDDVHDPLNLWMESGATDDRLWWRLTPTAAGDYVELLAQVSVAVSLNPCGDDVFGSSAFEVASIRATVRAATAAERTRWLRPAAGRRTGKGSRPLQPDPGYVPRYRVAPLERCALEVQLPDSAGPRLDALRRDRRFGDTDGEIVRAVLFRWWQERHAHTDPHATPGSSRSGCHESRR
jgi:uncharacterized protein YcgI (DUF1989 family)